MTLTSPERTTVGHGVLFKQAGAMLALATLSALLVFWLSGGFQSSQAAKSRVPGLASRHPVSGLEAHRTWAITSGSQGTLAFIRRIRSASPAELRAAFLSTRDYPLRCAITARWAAIDPAGCFETVRAAQKAAYGDIGLFFGVVPILFAQWARVDHAAAREALSGIREGRDRALAGFVDSCAEQGGEAWAALLDDPGFTMANPPAANFPRLSAEPLSLSQAMRNFSEAIHRGRYSLAMLGSLRYGAKGGDVDAAQAAWKQLPAGLRSSYTDGIIRSLMEKEPEQAAAFVAGLAPAERESASGTYAGTWAKKDPAASWDWLMQNVQGQRTSAASSWGSAVTPAEGARVLATAPSSRARDTAGVAFATEWLRTSPAEAATWMANIDDPDMKRKVWQETASVWVTSAPEQAVAAFIAAGAPPLSESRVKDVAGQLARSQPDLAKTFADGLPPRLAEAARSVLSAK